MSANTLSKNKIDAKTFPLRVKFAHELSKVFTPPNELVQGLITVEGVSVLCGPPNVGKTNLAIDMAIAVARGIDWMGRKTDGGMVLYLAAESPTSVLGRLQAYQHHHNLLIPNFVVVENSINLFKDDVGTNAIIKAVEILEKELGQKVKLIVGDTLARLSAGANENSGQDMGLVIERCDRIQRDCATHFMLIHHTGKNVAAGLRGWSGLAAAVDTIIEVIDHSTSPYAEVTKDRDLGSKGARIGFSLDVFNMGLTKWGAVATACVVVPAPAPQKAKTKRRSEVEEAVIGFLAGKNGETKAQVVRHFDGSYAKGPIYRAIKRLCEDATLLDTSGIVTLAGKTSDVS